MREWHTCSCFHRLDVKSVDSKFAWLSKDRHIPCLYQSSNISQPSRSILSISISSVKQDFMTFSESFKVRRMTLQSIEYEVNWSSQRKELLHRRMAKTKWTVGAQPESTSLDSSVFLEDEYTTTLVLSPHRFDLVLNYYWDDGLRQYQTSPNFSSWYSAQDFITECRSSWLSFFAANKKLESEIRKKTKSSAFRSRLCTA